MQGLKGQGALYRWEKEIVALGPTSADHLILIHTAVLFTDLPVLPMYAWSYSESCPSAMPWCFYPRDFMRKRCLCCRPVSIRPSVTLVDCIHMAEDIFKLLVRPGSPITLVFWSLVPIPNTKGNLFSRDAKYMENWRFSTEIAFI